MTVFVCYSKYAKRKTDWKVGDVKGIVKIIKNDA